MRYGRRTAIRTAIFITDLAMVFTALLGEDCKDCDQAAVRDDECVSNRRQDPGKARDPFCVGHNVDTDVAIQMAMACPVRLVQLAVSNSPWPACHRRCRILRSLTGFR